jgi:enoyl-CoA hydratase
MTPETLLLLREPVDPGDPKAGAILNIVLNRPAVRNAINKAMVDELTAALEAAAVDGDLRALVVSGGERAFASGADIAELKERGLGEALMRINAAVFARIEEHPLPSVAAIRGYALGGGSELAMACDVRIAGEGSKFGQPEVGLGIIPGAGAIQRLPHLVGLGVAKELILSGRIIDAKEAAAIGLVNRVVPDSAVLDEAKALARSIARNGPLAVRIAKAALNTAHAGARPEDAVDMLGQAVLFESKDKHDRMSAFLARRKAKGEQA